MATSTNSTLVVLERCWRASICELTMGVWVLAIRSLEEVRPYIDFRNRDGWVRRFNRHCDWYVKSSCNATALDLSYKGDP